MSWSFKGKTSASLNIPPKLSSKPRKQTPGCQDQLLHSNTFPATCLSLLNVNKQKSIATFFPEPTILQSSLGSSSYPDSPNVFKTTSQTVHRSQLQASKFRQNHQSCVCPNLLHTTLKDAKTHLWILYIQNFYISLAGLRKHISEQNQILNTKISENFGSLDQWFFSLGTLNSNFNSEKNFLPLIMVAQKKLLFHQQNIKHLDCVSIDIQLN